MNNNNIDLTEEEFIWEVCRVVTKEWNCLQSYFDCFTDEVRSCYNEGKTVEQTLEEVF